MQIAEHPVVKIQLDKLIFDKDNPNEMTKEQMEGLRQSMRKFGYLTPVIIDQNNKICDGEHRALVYKEFGIDNIPCIKLNLTDVDRRLLRQVLNKLHGTHDRNKDSDELKILFDNMKLNDLSVLIAQDLNKLENIININHPLLLNDEVIEYNVPSVVKKGQVWVLGEHKLVCADNQFAESYNFIKDEKIAQLNTDPPYGVYYGDKNKYLNEIYGGKRIERDIVNDGESVNLKDMFDNIFSNLKNRWAEYNTFYIWSGTMALEGIRQSIIDSGLTLSQYLVWIKNNHVLSRTDYKSKHEYILYGWHKKHKFYGPFRTTLLEYDRPIANDMHPTMKPVDLLAQTVTDGTLKNDIVLDVFAGSGSSLVAANSTGRIWRGIEIEPHYCDVILHRFEKLTGIKPRQEEA